MARPGRRATTGVHEVSPGRWRWRVMIDGVRHTGYAPTRAAAQLARAHAELDAGGAPVHDPTVADLLTGHMHDNDRAHTTRESWRWAYDCLPEAFLARRAGDVNPQIVAALWRQLRDQPPHRLVKVANLCSTAWQDALALGIVATNPWRIIAPPTPPPKADIVPPDLANVKALIDAADPWFRLWLVIASQTGARGGEVCALQWDDLDPVTGEILIRRNVTRTGELRATKTGVKGQRRVPLDDDALDLWADTRVVAKSDRWVFDRGDGEPLRPDGAAKRLERLCRLTGVDVSPHDLRHFAVTRWLAMGIPIPDVAAMVGDNPKTVMQTYAHHIPTQRRDMVRRLAKMIREA